MTTSGNVANRDGRRGTGSTSRSQDAAFERYIQERGAAWERYAFVLCGDAFRAEDLVQHALLKVYRHWTRITRDERADGAGADAAGDGTAGPDAYVRRVITNAYLDWRRRRSNAEVPTLVAVERRSHDADPGDRVADADELNRALHELSRHQRVVLVLRHFEGYDDAAIAEVLGCGESTVRSHASRGLQRLRDRLTPADSPSHPDTSQEHR